MKNGKTILALSALTVLISCSDGFVTLNRPFSTTSPQDVALPTVITTRPAVRVARASQPAVVRPTPRPALKLVSQPDPEIASQPKPKITSVEPRVRKPKARPDRPPQRVAVAAKPRTKSVCSSKLSDGIPTRSAKAQSGSAVVTKTMALGGRARDNLVVKQMLKGTIPSFLRDLTPVTFTGRTAAGKSVQVTICVMPDYLAVGSDADFVRIPLGLPAAATVATHFGFILPTTKMVDVIYAQAGLQLTPNPMQPGKQMSSTRYLWQHNKTVESQKSATKTAQNVLVAGQKKDLVLSNRLRSAPGRVAIYGWHRRNGSPIQPLSTVHSEAYADYSHGIRLVSNTAYVNGKPRSLAALLENPETAAIISKEGPIARSQSLMAALSRD